MGKFAVYCIADAAVSFGRNDAFTTRGLPCVTGGVNATVITRYVHQDPFTKTIPRGLLIEVQGEAPDLRSAVASFSAAANTIGALVAFTGNTAVGDFVPHVALDVERGKGARDFFQQFHVDPPLTPLSPRLLASGIVRDIAGAILHCPNSERLTRAVAHYHSALQNWLPGREIPAAHSLWMAMECLTPIARDRHLAESGKSREEVAKDWSVDPKQLDAEARHRLLFKANTDLYSAAKKAFDGLEHGFLPIWDIRTTSLERQTVLARYVREAILSLAEVPSEIQESLLAGPFERPGHFMVAKYFFGQLNGAEESFRPTDHLYPHLVWRPEFVEQPNPDPDEITILFQETLKAVIPPGASIKQGGIEVWGSSIPGQDAV
jgi:hypothetical protein